MKNLFDVTGKVIIVTGAAGKLGSGYALSLKEAGATVLAWDKELGKLQDVLAGDTSGIEMYALDITRENEVEQTVSKIIEKHGRIDALINNAAMNPAVGSEDAAQQFVPYEEYPIELFRKEIDTNLTGMMIVMKHVAPIMIKQRTGSIVNIASEVSTIAHDHRVYNSEGRYKSPAYTASKTAVLGLTRQWAARLGECNVRVNAISIGGVQFPGIPEDFKQRFGGANMLGRMANPGEYDASIQYLCSDASSFMTGSNLIIDGGKAAW